MIAHKERITLAIVTALEAIEQGVDYPIDIENVVRPKGSFPEDAELGDRWITVEQQEMEAEIDGYGLGDHAESCSQQYWITGWLAVSRHNANPIDKLLNEFEASIVKALKVDHTLGGLALNVRRTGSAPEPRAAFEGIRVEFIVDYSEDEPFTA